MGDPNAGQYHKNGEFITDFATAERYLSQFGGSLDWSTNDYEAFRYVDSDHGVVIIFYPHRTSAGNYHLRVRDGGSKNLKRADALMVNLHKVSGYNCTFSRKRHHSFPGEELVEIE